MINITDDLWRRTNAICHANKRSPASPPFFISLPMTPSQKCDIFANEVSSPWRKAPKILGKCFLITVLQERKEGVFSAKSGVKFDRILFPYTKPVSFLFGIIFPTL